MKKYMCAICKKRIFTDGLVLKRDSIWEISGEHAFHYYDTHGIPVEIFEEQVNQLIDAARELVKGGC